MPKGPGANKREEATITPTAAAAANNILIHEALKPTETVSAISHWRA